jgi:hypothetical protein
MLFPRTQCVQLQEEYWNAAQSFEFFQRSFGECDVIHEEQVAKAGVGDYRVLLLFDVKLLPAAVTKRIEEFVAAGGIVIADCVPDQDELRRPSDAMAKLFGVRDADTHRILWPVKMDPEWELDPQGPAVMPPATQPTDRVRGTFAQHEFDFPIVSPRPCKLAGGRQMLTTANGSPAVVQTGIAQVYLLGFCLQDTLFEARRTGDRKTLEQIDRLLNALLAERRVRPHVHSSNPEVEAAVRAGEREAFLFVISHEAAAPGEVEVQVGGLPFKIGRVVDVATGEKMPLAERLGVDDGVMIQTAAPTGTTRLYRLSPP